jgi:glutamine synthetase
VLNTIVAEVFDEIATYLEKLPKAEFNTGLQKKLSEIVKKHKRVIFNGDGYDASWEKEAEKRGLPNLKNTPEALKPLLDPKNIELFEKYGVFTRSEMVSRYEVFAEEYSRKVQIEASMALNIAKTMILPAATDHLADLAGTLVWKNKEIEANGKMISAMVSDLLKAIDALEKETKKPHNEAKKLEAMSNLRSVVDAL